MTERQTRTSRETIAGCFTCHGGDAHWTGPNAQATAARHHDATQHPTWCDVSMSIWYGQRQVDPRQTDIEDAIGASPA